MSGTVRRRASTLVELLLVVIILAVLIGLLLTVGTFAGAYPLMYFAQEYVSLGPAVVASAGLAVAIIGVRAITLMGFWRGLGGVVLPAAFILALTLVAAIWPALQGILLTVLALAFFVAVMMVLPHIELEHSLWPESPFPAPPPAPRPAQRDPLGPPG